SRRSSSVLFRGRVRLGSLGIRCERSDRSGGSLCKSWCRARICGKCPGVRNRETLTLLRSSSNSRHARKPSQRQDLQGPFALFADRFDHHARGGENGAVGNFSLKSGTTDGEAVFDRLFVGSGVDHERELAFANRGFAVGFSFVYFVDALGAEIVPVQKVRGL